MCLSGRAMSKGLMIKSMLLRAPALYERVQRFRDDRWLRQARQSGSYAQHGEDRALLEMLQGESVHGPYVDLGCNHPFKLSNTYLLYLHGYSGLCIDPLPRFRPLYARWRPKDCFMTVAIGEQAGELPFFEFESDVLSTVDAGLAASYQAQGWRLRRINSVRIERLDSVLEQARLTGPISLLSIDIEGHELPALHSLDLARWRPRLVCLEVATAGGSRRGEAVAHLQARGYEIALDLGLNVILRRLV
jgi:FkbM family methyltransferase